MEEFQYHHHHHHHHHHPGHGYDGNPESEQYQYATSFHDAENSNNVDVTQHYHHQQQQQQQQETVTHSDVTIPAELYNVPTNETLGGVQSTGSFHSVSSLDSLAEMSKYFPDAQTPSLSPFRHQLEVGGQAQSTAISNTRNTTTTNTVNAGPYIPVFGPTEVQRLPQPVTVPFMAQQQRPIRPPGSSQIPQGIPSYPSQVEGLSVSQAVVNDVLVDLQSKVINETLQQYQNGSVEGDFLEPLPPIFIQAPQPTIILRSDVNRLREELNKSVRPQVVYRHPADANQFQQQRFQQNAFQTPRFPAPSQQFPPECSREYRNAAYTNSGEYKTTTTISDEHRKENEARLYNQAESPEFNNDNINANVHSALDLQGLSTTSFDHCTSPYHSSISHPNFEDQQQGNERAVFAASQRVNNEEVGKTDNMPIHNRQEITFDIDNCIIRCFEAHRQRLARRRAARHARRAKRHRQSGQQRDPQLYPNDGLQTFSTQRTHSSIDSADQIPWLQQLSSSSQYSDTLPDTMNSTSSMRTSERSYIPSAEYDYGDTVQSTLLSASTQHYPTSDIVNTQTNQVPFSSSSTFNMNAVSSAGLQSLGNDYQEFGSISTQEPYNESKQFEYNSYQSVPSANDLTQQPLRQQQQQQQTSFDYSNQLPYTSFSPADATVPGDVQHLTSDYYQQQTPAQFIQAQEAHIQASNAFNYGTGSTQSQRPEYNYQNIEQQSFQYPYDIENMQQQSMNYNTIASAVYAPSETDIQHTEQKQTFNYSNQQLNSNDYYQHPPVAVPISHTQEAYGQPSGTYEYTKESYHSQGPVYDQNVDQQSSQYPYDIGDSQEIPQQHSYDFPTAATHTYSPSQIDTDTNEQRQTFDYSRQGISSSDYYQQQSVPVPTAQTQETYVQPSTAFEYATENTQSHGSAYDYQNVEQQSFQYPYNIENIEQQQSFNYKTEDTSTYRSPESNLQQTEQKQPYDYSSQALTSSESYQQHPVSVPISQIQGPYDQPPGSFEYPTVSTQSQIPNLDQQNTEQQQQSFEYKTEDTSTYISPESNLQQTEQKQPYDYSSQALTSSESYQQHPVSVPISQVQGTYDQTPGSFDFNKEGYQHQEPLFDYQNTDQQSSHYSYNLEDTRQQPAQQQEAFNYPSEATTVQSTSETDIQQSEQRQRTDYANQTISSNDHYQQKPVSIPISQVYDSQPHSQRVSGASIPTGTVEYTRQTYYSQEPSLDSTIKESSKNQHQQHDESETFSINDYLRKFETESYSQHIGGQVKSSDDYQSITTTTTTPNTVQPTADTYQPAGTAQTYDLQNYTNESIQSGTAHSAPPSSSTCEEDQHHLLQQTSMTEQTHEPIPQSELRSEIEGSIYDTYTSLPPPPPSSLSMTKESARQVGSVTANPYDFPAPPTPDRHSFQISPKRPSRSFASIIPSSNQPSIYSGHQPLPLTSPTSSDNRSDEDAKEDEEIFDLRDCIARCYAKYRESWNKEQQRQYEQQMNASQQQILNTNTTDKQQHGQYQQISSQQSIPSSNQRFIPQSNTFLSMHTGQQNQSPQQQQFGADEIHYNDGWTQTASLDVTKQSNIAQHAYDQTPPSYDTTPYIAQLSTRDFSTDSRGQQTIEYSPPLITQTHHVIPPIPSSSPSPYHDFVKHEQQQQQQQEQQMYNHALPIPSHLSFNETNYQANLSFSSQITPQPQKYENTPFDRHDDYEQQQQRFRAHSEPASIQQDSISSNTPSQPASTNIFDQQSRRSYSTPMIHQEEQQQQQQQQSGLPSVRMIDNGRAYETEAVFRRHVPRVDPKTGLCLVPCPETKKYAHLPPHLRPELFCIELPPVGSLPPVPPTPPPAPPGQQQQQQQRWCVKCCCKPGRTLIKKIVYKQVEDEKQQSQESNYDYASVMDQMATRISVRYGNSIMEEGEPFVSGNYCEKLRIIDFPVYVSGKNDPNLTPLVPVN